MAYKALKKEVVRAEAFPMTYLVDYSADCSGAWAGEEDPLASVGWGEWVADEAV